MKMPIFEVLDRYTIWLLKNERIGGKEVEAAYLFFSKEAENIVKKYPTIEPLIDGLYLKNRDIWDLEADLRAGKEQELGLDEVGRRALKIRDINKERISIKATIIDITGEGFKDVKVNHCSE